jgi:hypothetical protein
MADPQAWIAGEHHQEWLRIDAEKSLGDTTIVDNTKVIVAFMCVGGVLIWELFSGMIPSKTYVTKRADSPVAYWIGILLQLALLGYFVWRFDFDVMRDYSFRDKALLGASAFVWSILLVLGVLSQVTHDDSQKDDDSNSSTSSE